jgi:hypothetical protein
MGEAHHSFTGPPHTHRRARMEAAQQATTTPQAHPQVPRWDTGYEGGYSGHHEGSSYYPSHGYPGSSLRAGTSASITYPDWYSPMERYISYGLTKMSAQQRGSDNSSDRWMTLQPCKQKCKHPSTHIPA